MLLSQEEFKQSLTSCLRHLAQMSEDRLLDFHTDYGHARQAIVAALGYLEDAESLTYRQSIWGKGREHEGGVSPCE